MPYYTFECNYCKHVAQFRRPMSECSSELACPECDRGIMSRVFGMTKTLTSSKDRVNKGKDSMIYTDIRKNLSKKFGIKPGA